MAAPDTVIASPTVDVVAAHVGAGDTTASGQVVAPIAAADLVFAHTAVDVVGAAFAVHGVGSTPTVQIEVRVVRPGHGVGLLGTVAGVLGATAYRLGQGYPASHEQRRGHRRKQQCRSHLQHHLALPFVRGAPLCWWAFPYLKLTLGIVEP